MDKNELIKKINNFLEESPLSDEDVKLWQKKIVKMNSQELEKLDSLLREKIKIITDTNQVFINIAEDVAKAEEENLKNIPKSFSIEDMSISDLEDIFNNGLVKILEDKKYDFISQLDKYFQLNYSLGEDIVKEFDTLIKALNENKEILFVHNKNIGRVSIGKWINMYNQFNDSQKRKSIDRINFVNQDKIAKKLNTEERNFLLKFLKLYDFIINPERTSLNEEIKQGILQPGKISGPPKTAEEKEIDKMKIEEEKYMTGGLEQQAIEEEVEKKKKVEDLKAVASKYKPDSLEYKAMMEEIEKITK